MGASDVEVIEQSTAAFVRQDFATGAGPIRDLAVAQLRATLPLLGAEMTPKVRPRLYLATACLATQAGWMSFQVNKDDVARRLWLITLDIARDTDHPLGTDHTVFVLYDMALQAVSLNRPEEALRLVHLAHAAAAGPHPVSAATASCLASIQARAHQPRGTPQPVTGRWARPSSGSPLSTRHHASRGARRSSMKPISLPTKARPTTGWPWLSMTRAPQNGRWCCCATPWTASAPTTPGPAHGCS